LDQEGIFRIPGAASAVDRIFAACEHPPLNVDAEENPHNVAGAFKQLLRSLDEEPVLPFELFDDVSRVGALYRSNSDEALREAKLLIGKMKEINIKAFDRVCTLLRLTASRSEQNKMDLHNVAIVFGPTLIRDHPSKETPMTLMSTGESTRQFLEMVLEHYQEIITVAASVLGQPATPPDAAGASVTPATPAAGSVQ